MIHLVCGVLYIWLLFSVISSIRPVFLARDIPFLANIPAVVCDLALMAGLMRTMYLGEARAGMLLFYWGRDLCRSLVVVLKLMLYFIFISALLMVVGISLIVLLAGRHAILLLALSGLALAVAAFFVFGRLLLAVPAAAIGRRACLSLSWHATKGNVLRLVGACFLVNMPVFFIGMPPAFVELGTIVTTGPHATSATFHVSMASALLGYFNMALGTTTVMAAIVMFSIAYGKLICDREPESAIAIL